ncbi:unnamed protein product [Acanthoscelides obtectus]|uniref:Uncharacterized protein n=1 Tax=Acanthoscelides obtectus TaxID=200917 RepID=A0A9P0P2N6_ACAOB|nr:unnamed protein product [Acanthoscelides obtectus]CAK1666626.1 hypothetical protein AOBTE_LOCUS25405 [Acanthoscelides obtectus]
MYRLSILCIFTIAISWAQQPLEPPITSYDYIVKFTINMDENKVPYYIVNGIYNRFEGNVTVDDVIQLYRIRQLSLNQAKLVLNSMDVPTDTVFSGDTFETVLKDLRLDFTTFYSNVFLLSFGTSGEPLRIFLETLDIDLPAFTSSIVLGMGDPLDVIKQGNFSNLEPALNEIGKTPNDLYKASMNTFADAAVKLSLREFVEILKKNGLTEAKALILWNTIGIDVRDIYLNQDFNKLLLETNMDLRKDVVGVLIGNNSIVTDINVGIFLKEAKQISRIEAKPLNDTLELKDIKPAYSSFESLAVLNFQSEHNTSYISYGMLNGKEENCTFITLRNDTIVTEIVTPVDKKTHVEIESKMPSEYVIPGSPLVCDDKVYGLARDNGHSSGIVILDNFREITSGTNMLSSCLVVLIIGIINMIL